MLSCVSLWGALCGCVSWGVAACCVAPPLCLAGLGGNEAGDGLLEVSLATAGRSQETSAQEGRLQLREGAGGPGRAGARPCLCHRPAFLPLAPPCATQFGHEQLLVWLLYSDLSARGLALRCLFPSSWLLVGLCVGTHGYPGPRSAVAPAGLAPHSPAGPGDSPQLLGSRERRTEPPGGHQPLGPAAVVTSGFDGTTRWAVR